MKFIILIVISFFSAYGFSNEHSPDLKVSQIHNNVFLHTSYKQVEPYGTVDSNGLVVIENNKAFIIDTPWSHQDTKKLASWIIERGHTLSGSISTHSHEDRTAGIKWLNAQSIPTYATKLTNDILKSEEKEPAKYTLSESNFKLANGAIEVFYPGGGHTIDNIVIWLPNSKILFGGCFIRSLESKKLGYTGEAHIKQWANSANKTLLKYPDVKMVIPGHGKVGDIDLLMHTKTLAETADNSSKALTHSEHSH